MSQIGPMPDEPRVATWARSLLAAPAIVALLHGLLYLALIPPWQHYDEPTHFEYVRLVVERGRLPRPGDAELEMQREIAASMRDAGFWELLNAQPPDLTSEEAPYIGFSELEHPPFYYLAVAWLPWLFGGGNIETQLYLARLASVLLYPILVVAVFGLAAEAFPGRRGLHLAAAWLVALLPPLADLMSSVNNDAGATAVSSLLLWSSARLLRRGFSPGRACLTLLLAGACLLTKNTAGAVAVIVLFVLGLALVPRPWRPWAWGAAALLGAIAVAAAFTWTEQAAHWYNDDLSTAPNRVSSPAPAGSRVFALSRDGQDHPAALSQELQITEGQALRGHVVTFGAWLRATDEQGGAVAIRLYDGSAWHWQNVPVTPDWQFHSLTATIAPEAPTVSASIGFPVKDPAQSVYADGIVLVDGAIASREPPSFGSAQAEAGTWGGQSFTNLLRNGSAERAWPGLRSWLRGLKVYRTSASQVLASALDWARTAWVYRPVVNGLVIGFWGRFGWGTPALPAGWLALFWALGLAAAAGVVVELARGGGTPWWRGGLALGAALVVGWGSTVLRIHPVLVLKQVYWPGARYAFVVIGPTALVLCAGLAALVPRRWRRPAAYAGLVGVVALNAVVLSTVVVPYFYR